MPPIPHYDRSHNVARLRLPVQNILQAGVIDIENAMRRRFMDEAGTDNSCLKPWTAEELELLEILMVLKVPMDIICNEFERSWTATALKAIDLGLNLFS